MDIYKTLLLFALVCALAAFFVMWAKWEEEKVKTRAERENYRAALNLHNAAAEAAQLLAAEKDALNAEIARLNECLDTEFEFADAQIDKNREIQDRLSAILCPRNDHVWKDGVCVKCGRAQDGT